MLSFNATVGGEGDEYQVVLPGPGLLSLKMKPAGARAGPGQEDRMAS